MKAKSTQAGLSIAAVERDIGLSKDTLRVWERRYGFPQPARDATGERSYSAAELAKLRLMKHLMDYGQRPGKIVHQSLDQLRELAATLVAPGNPASAPVNQAELASYMELLHSRRLDHLRRALSQALARAGLASFISHLAAPLTRLVGESWARGECEVFEEHFYTETLQGLLRNAINAIPQTDAAPRVLLTTFPHEVHGLGLLMAEALFTLERCTCISLGVQTPPRDIARAAITQQADIVALSFSPIFAGAALLAGLQELRQLLPEPVEIWVGGGNAALRRRLPVPITPVFDLEGVAAALARWRAAHAPRSDEEPAATSA